MDVKKIVSLSIIVALVTISIVTIPQVFVKPNKGIKVGSGGSVKAIGVAIYWDSSCTDEVTFLDWSALDAGASGVRTVYIKNTGNANIVLSLDTANWSPPNAANFIALAWDYADQPISPGAIVEITLTLTLSSSITGITDFSFDIILTYVD